MFLAHFVSYHIPEQILISVIYFSNSHTHIYICVRLSAS